MGTGCFETFRNILPIDNVPERGYIVGFDVLVVEVEGVLPHIELQNRDSSLGGVCLLVKELLNHEP